MGKDKNPAAVILGKLGGLIGGRARAAILSPARRVEISRAATYKRWDTSHKGDAPKVLFTAVQQPHYIQGYQYWTEREMIEVVGAHYPYWDWPMAEMATIRPLRTSGEHRPSRTYRVRDVVTKLPRRTRCTICGNPWSRWDNAWRFLHRTIRQCSIPCVKVLVRAAQREQRQRRKEAQWLADAKVLLKQVRAAARGDVPKA